MKQITHVIREGDSHWVGDGFPVRNMFSYNTPGVDISPFLLLDYAGPHEFSPAVQPRGVGQHPHRGFETVTLVYHGEVEHRDTAGNSGSIGPGDVQWMTAARGVLHEEMHSKRFTQRGGRLEAVQLWVNLPAANKMDEPGYQAITYEMIPVVTLADNAGTVRVIAGQFGGANGPARTHTPVNLWDIQLNATERLTLTLPSGHTTAVFVLSGQLTVNDHETLGAAQLACFEREGETVLLHAEEHSRLLLMGGQPIDEPVAGQGPFVMNTQAEIRQAMEDFNAGRF